MSFRCREGHPSDESDYCSVCGVAIGAASAAPRAAAAAPEKPARPPSFNTPLPGSVKQALPRVCPACGEPRAEPDARFCEVCRYDFIAAKPGPPPVGAAPSSRAASPPASTASPSSVAMPVSVPAPLSVGRGSRWEVHVSVDASLDKEPDPDWPCPTNAPLTIFPLDRPVSLVGRHDAPRDIHPEVAVDDPGASRRHAKLVVLADGGVALQDLASTNGTRLNGVELAPGSRAELRAGDEVTLGRWTRITLRSKA